MNPDNPQLNCLVMSSETAKHKQVSSWLGVSKRVSSVTAVSDELSLAKYLSRAECHLCILVIDNNGQTLPSCTLQYPNMRVLALTTGSQADKPEMFYQQGATDVVSLNNVSMAQHAISRLIDECVQQLKLQRLQTRTEQLKEELNALRLKLQNDHRVYPLKASNDLVHDRSSVSTAHFQTMDTPVIENIITKSNLRDSATGLPSRTTALKRFQAMLHSDIKAPRFTAMMVSILSDGKTKQQNGAEKNVQDLTLYRAADALQKCVAQSTIFGRLNQNALLLIQPSDIEPVSRDAATRVRESLGTLGGLIDSRSDIHINTMNLPSTTKISADEVLERLETLTS